MSSEELCAETALSAFCKVNGCTQEEALRLTTAKKFLTEIGYDSKAQAAIPVGISPLEPFLVEANAKNTLEQEESTKYIIYEKNDSGRTISTKKAWEYRMYLANEIARNTNLKEPIKTTFIKLSATQIPSFLEAFTNVLQNRDGPGAESENKKAYLTLKVPSRWEKIWAGLGLSTAAGWALADMLSAGKIVDLFEITRGLDQASVHLAFAGVTIAAVIMSLFSRQYVKAYYFDAFRKILENRNDAGELFLQIPYQVIGANNETIIRHLNALYFKSVGSSEPVLYIIDR